MDIHDFQHAVGSETSTIIAYSQYYIVWLQHGRVRTLEISTNHSWILPDFVHNASPGTRLVGSLSSLNTHLLALSVGSEVFVCDLEHEIVIQSVNGNGRTVTAISWSPLRASLLAVGTVDSRISIWELGPTPILAHQLFSPTSACEDIKISPVDDALLASLHKNQVQIWKLEPYPKLVSTVLAWKSNTSLNNIAWNWNVSHKLLLGASDGSLAWCDLASDVSARGIARDGGRSAGIEKDSEFVNSTYSVVQEIHVESIGKKLDKIFFPGEHSLVTVSKPDQFVRIFALAESGVDGVERWNCDFGASVRAVHIGREDDRLVLIGIGGDGLHHREVPQDVLDDLTFRNNVSIIPQAMVAPSGMDMLLPGSSHVPVTKRSNKMMPVRISEQRKSDKDSGSNGMSRHAIESRQLIQDNSSVLRRESVSTTVPLVSSRIEQLDFSILRDEPNKTKQIETLGDSHLPQRNIDTANSSTGTTPLQTHSFGSSLPSTQPDHDSDSDDDTFADTIAGSGTLLPGGVHVPLPKACGALFAPNGQLLTFFPPKIRNRPVVQDVRSPEMPRAHESRASRLARMFPSFGNLASDTTPPVDDVESDLSSDSDEIAALPLWTSSSNHFQSPVATTNSWTTKPVGISGKAEIEVDHKVIVSVNNLPEYDPVFPDQRKVASKYHIFNNAPLTHTNVCSYNAKIAKEASLSSAAEIWGYLSIILDNREYVGSMGSQDRQVGSIRATTETKTTKRRDSVLEVAGIPQFVAAETGVLWWEHPLGHVWLVRRLFQWAELQADVQILACMAAILHQAEVDKSSAKDRRGDHTRRYAPKPIHSAIRVGHITQSKTGKLTPILRPRSSYDASATEDPKKQSRPESGSSSRNQSQPPTPYLDSPTSFTAAVSSALMSRQNTKFSAGTTTGAPSASNSPELSRGSFGAAARYYAQTITDKFADKFASYGTSPPLLKSGYSKSSGSPRNPEQLSSSLSSSLPRNSLSKSVSFVSTAETWSDRLLSRESGPRSSGWHGRGNSDGYESDRTVAVRGITSITPPKGSPKKVQVTMKNRHSFIGRVGSGPKSELIPEDLRIRAAVWMQTHAEQLRTWDMWQLAANFEKAASQVDDVSTAQSESDPCLPHGVIVSPAAPSPANKSKVQICSICTTIELGAMQSCTSCLHTAHLSCLDAYVMATCGPSGGSLNPTKSIAEIFTCPSGCGCACAGLDYVSTEYAEQDASEDEDATTAGNRSGSSFSRTVIKRPSFTDPRRWRARVEGDSW